MKIEEESSSKVEEVVEKKQISSNKTQATEDPVIEEEGEGKENVESNNQTKTAEQPTTVDKPKPSEEPSQPQAVPKEEPKKSEFVKLNIEEAEDSSEEETEKPKQAESVPESVERPQESSTPEKISQFDKNFMKHENVSADFIHSFDQLHVTELPSPTEESKVEEIKEEVAAPVISEQEQEELKQLDLIESELMQYKAAAKEEHSKGMFEKSIELYQEALMLLDDRERLFKVRLGDLIAKKCSLWNNIAA